MNSAFLLAILPIVSAATETAIASSVPTRNSCNLSYEIEEDTRGKYCADEDLVCLCSLSNDEYWLYYADCDCINPGLLDVDFVKSQACANVSGSAPESPLSNATTLSEILVDPTYVVTESFLPAVAAATDPTTKVPELAQAPSLQGMNDSTSLPQVNVQLENLGSKMIPLSVGALAVLALNLL